MCVSAISPLWQVGVRNPSIHHSDSDRCADSNAIFTLSLSLTISTFIYCIHCSSECMLMYQLHVYFIDIAAFMLNPSYNSVHLMSDF
ncbi:hypothetical protein PROFUN_01751 [Planoprotostelium fungivorum]|uniref:Uncharacterized protein n=1 Tax=Planoprotostelium fungivorum TaxID=1890364 RepID=A0A2P6MWF7_9EUKA|nr:hypothetical protein PROFUN_01751 [Planoprotostelium fungivorum]